MSTSGGLSVEVRIPSRLGFEKFGTDTAASMARMMGFSRDRIDNLKTSLAEVCINAIEHGNKLNSGQWRRDDHSLPRSGYQGKIIACNGSSKA